MFKRLLPAPNSGPSCALGCQQSPQVWSDRASREWDLLSSELAEAGLQISVAHRAPLAIAATIAADIAEAWEPIQRDGAYVMGKTHTGLQAHPAVKRMDALRRDYLKALSSLGLRSAVSSETSAEESLEDILNG